MNRQLFLTLAVVGGGLATAGPAVAQYPYPTAPGGYQPGGAYGTPGRPPISPYLNITQGTGNPAVNYYNFTRPALQQQQFYQQQQAFGYPALTEPFGLASVDVGLLPQYDPTNKTPRPTGHPTYFMTPAGYFNSLGTIGSAGGPAGRGTGAAPRPQTTPTTPR